MDVGKGREQERKLFRQTPPDLAGNATSRYALGWPYSGLHPQRPACSEHRKLDLPGFKNLEGLHISMTLARRHLCITMRAGAWEPAKPTSKIRKVSKINISLYPDFLSIGSESICIVISIFSQQRIMLAEFFDRLKIPFLAVMNTPGIIGKIMINT